MKVHFKKLISIILAVALVVSMLVVPAGAADDGYDYNPQASSWQSFYNALADALTKSFPQVNTFFEFLDDLSLPHVGPCSYEELLECERYYNNNYVAVLARAIDQNLSSGVLTYAVLTDADDGVLRLCDVATGEWIVNKDGEYPYCFFEGDANDETFESIYSGSNQWIPISQVGTKTEPMSKSVLDERCLELNDDCHPCRVVETIKFGGVKYYVIQDYSTDAGENRVYCNSEGYAYVAIAEPSATNNQYDYIIDDSITVNDSQIIDIENGILNLIDDSGTKISLNIEDLTFDTGSKDYSVTAYSTTNEGDNHYYTYYTYNITYNIANTYITYIGSNDAYDKEEYKYYYELPDGRSSADLTADEIAGMSFEFHDVVNYERSATDVSVRALYHFDGDTSDSSYFSTQGRFEWTNGASITYMEAPEAFDGALYLDNTAHSFDIVLPSGLGSADSTIQFRYYQASEPDTQDNIDNFIKIGGTYVLCWDEKTVSRDPDGEHAAWTLPVGTWNEIALVRDDGQLLVYLNGLCVSREAYPTVWGDTITFELGSGSRAYSMIDELRVLNRPITSLGDDYIFVNSISQCTDPDQLYVLPDGYIYKYSESRLPEGYTEVEYIQSSGTQYIDTGVVPGSGYTASIDFQSVWSPSSSSESWIFSLWEGDSAYWRAGFAGSSFSENFGFSYSQTSSATARTTANGVCPLPASLSAYLFSQHESKGAVHTSFSKYILYSCRISDSSGTLVRNFVPCIDPNRVAGLYDLVTSSFYGNNGSGSFSTGSAVSAGWTSTGVLYDSLGYGDGTSYTPTAVPYDSNLVLVLPDAAKPIADEYWSFNPEGNLLSDYDFTTSTDHSADWYYNPSTTTVLYGDACSVTNNSTLDLASSVPGYCAGQKTIDSANGDYVPSNGLVSSFGNMAIVNNTNFNWDAGGYFYRPDLNSTYTLSVVGVDGVTYSHTFTVSAVTTTSDYGLVGNDRTYTEFDWGYLFYYRHYDGGPSQMMNYHSIGILPKPGMTFEFVYAELVPGSVANEGHEKVTCVYPESSVQPNTAAIQTTIPVKGYTVGGVRPTLPAKGNVWFPVQENRIQACYIYTGSMWQEVGCRWYTGSRWIPIYAFDLTTLEDLFDIADAADAIVPIISESGFWRWWQLQWLDFRAWLEDALSKIGSSGSGGSSVSGDDIIVILPGESGSFDESGEEQDDGWSFLDLLKAVKDGAWKITKGIVVTGAGGVVGVIGLIGDIGDFFDAYDDSNSESIWGVVNYGGADIWD